MPELKETILVKTVGSNQNVDIKNSEIMDFVEKHNVHKIEDLSYYNSNDIERYLHVYLTSNRTIVKTSLYAVYSILNNCKFIISEHFNKANQPELANEFLATLIKREYLELQIEEKQNSAKQELESSGSVVYVDNFEGVLDGNL